MKYKSLLCCAAEAGHQHILEFLAPLMGDILRYTQADSLCWAVQAGQIDTVRYLLHLGFKADWIGAASFDCETPIHIAVKYDRLEILEILINQEDVNVCVKTRSHYSPLIEAVNTGKEEAIKLLLPKAPLEYGPVLLIAARKGLISTLRFLFDEFEYQVNVNYQGLLNDTALTIAAMKNRFDCVKYLLEKNALVDHRDSSGFSALHYVCKSQYRSEEMIKLLLSYWANIHQKHMEGERGKTPFDFIIKSKDWKLASYVLTLVNEKDRAVLIKKLPIESGISELICSCEAEEEEHNLSISF